MPKHKKLDISWVNPDQKGLNKKEKYLSGVRTVTETTETYKDVKQGPALIKALAEKYGQNPNAAVKRFKKSFIDAGVKVPDSWRNTGGVTTKSNTVDKVYRPIGKE